MFSAQNIFSAKIAGEIFVAFNIIFKASIFASNHGVTNLTLFALTLGPNSNARPFENLKHDESQGPTEVQFGAEEVSFQDTPSIAVEKTQNRRFWPRWRRRSHGRECGSSPRKYSRGRPSSAWKWTRNGEFSAQVKLQLNSGIWICWK